MNIDTILMSPPCQPFTRVGLKKDILDKRTDCLLHVLEFIPHIQTLKYVLLENVKGFENSQARNELVDCMRKSNFDYKELILSPCQFGIPNTRHRYYMIAKKKELCLCFKDPDLIHSLPTEILQILSENCHTQVANLQLAVNCKNGKEHSKLSNIIERDADEKYLISRKLLAKHARIFDIRTPESEGTCCFTKAYSHYVEGTGSIFCPFNDNHLRKVYEESKNYKKDCPDGLDSLCNLRLRYFTPKEVSRLMCFPETFLFPDNITDKQRYRLLGNSINVYVVSQLLLLLVHEAI
ncbi:tRNA (cytosine(38)-C(5))-methyltransferase isoform X2 [Cephus cinctus]|nr:tRNA (cytosine(38)-C(5))-methyltransferase isoform X2 [Cephus cinctus]